MTEASNDYTKIAETPGTAVWGADEATKAYHQGFYEGTLAAGRQQAPTPDGLPVGHVDRITAAVREADIAFEEEGGSSRHFVRECLLPALEAAGLVIVSK